MRLRCEHWVLMTQPLGEEWQELLAVVGMCKMSGKGGQ